MPKHSKLIQKWRLKIFLTLLVAVLVLSLLFWKAESVSQQEYYHQVQLVEAIGLRNAQIDAEILSARLGLSKNYDALTQYLSRMQSLARQLHRPIDFLAGDSQAQYHEVILKLEHNLQTKAKKIDYFKRENSVLLNSLAHFQTQTNQFLNRAGLPLLLIEKMNLYMRTIEVFNDNPSDENLQQVRSQGERFQGLNLKTELQAPLQLILLHGGIITQKTPAVNQLMREALRIPITNILQDSLNRVQAGYQQALSQAGIYRTLLYIAALVMTVYLGYLFMMLVVIGKRLESTNHELKKRYNQLKKAKEALHLHGKAFESSHDGILLTDDKGRIVDVNPAFTRITGYSKDEALGKNPRMLKSGRQEENFYHEMWNSIRQFGSWSGEIWNRNRSGFIVPMYESISKVEDASGKISHYVAIFSDMRRIKDQELQLRKMAYYDALTNLPNRVLFTDRLKQAIARADREKTQMAVCFLDLDNFKPVNDQYGHEVGDELLINLSHRITKELRSGDTVARLGGDEFVLLFNGEHHENFETVAKRLLHTCCQPFHLKNREILVTASIGVTFYPTDHTDPDTLLRHADQAMYVAKQTGRNRFHLFDQEKDDAARSVVEQIARIENGLNEQQFVLHYQPKVNMRSGAVFGCEALIRWIDPQRGLVSPNDFLPLIEDHPLMVQIGDFVIDQALQQISEWKNQGYSLSISVNVASLQLQDKRFVDKLKQALSRYPDLSPEQLELEILETAALHDIVSISDLLTACHDLGVKTALDDFGTGYSSLTYLKRLPATTLKVDQSFVRDMLEDNESLAIVQGVLGLTAAFQKEVIAEGVESVDHGRLLLQLGCEQAQGFGIARPMPAQDVLPWIESWQAPSRWMDIRNLKWDDSDFPMFAAQVEHNLWMKRLLLEIEQGSPLSGELLLDHHHCQFGKWFDGHGKEKYSRYSSYQEIELLHARLHQQVKKLDQCMRSSMSQSLSVELNQLRQNSLQLHEKLNQLMLDSAQPLFPAQQQIS